MTRQTILGVLFICIGLAILALVGAPIVIAIKAHSALPDVSIKLLITGLATSLFGAWLLPSSGVGATTVNILAVAGPFIPTFGRRTNSGEQSAVAGSIAPKDPKGGAA